MNPTALKGELRKAKARITMKKNGKNNQILKTKKEIRAKLEAGNETMALIAIEPLINDERMIPCFEVLDMLCQNTIERAQMLAKIGKDIPPDMKTTLHTLVYASNRAGVEELVSIGNKISVACGKDFAKETETDEKCVHPVIRENINLISPEEGWKVERLIQLASEEGIQYQPSERAMTVLFVR